MATVLRLARAGAKKRPYYQIVATDSRNPRDGSYIEQVGSYNPMLPRDHADRIKLKTERLQYWLQVGAQPTERVALFLSAAGLVKAKPNAASPKKSAPKAKAQERLREQNEKAEAAQEAKQQAEADAKQAAADEAAAAAEAKQAAAAEAAAPAPEAAAAEAPAAETPAETPEA